MLWALKGRLLVQLDMLDLPLFSGAMRQHCSHGGLPVVLEYALCRMSKDGLGDIWRIWRKEVVLHLRTAPLRRMSKYGHSTRRLPSLVALDGKHTAKQKAVSTCVMDTGSASGQHSAKMVVIGLMGTRLKASF